MKRETVFFFWEGNSNRSFAKKWIFNRNNRVEEVDRDPLGINWVGHQPVCCLLLFFILCFPWDQKTHD